MSRTGSVWRALSPYRWRLAVAVFVSALACGLNLPAPLLVREILDSAASDTARTPLIWLGVVFAAQAAVHAIHARLVGAIGVDLIRDLRERLYHHLQHIGVSFFDRTPAGAIISRLMDDVVAVQALATGPNVALFVELGTAAIVIGFLSLRSPLTLGVVGVLAPLYLWIFLRIGRRLRIETEDVRRRLDSVFSHLKAKFDGICVVKAHACEDIEIERFAEQMNEAHEPRLRLERLNALMSSLAFTGVGVGVAAVFAVAAFEATQGRMTPADVGAAGALAALLFAPLPRIADAIAVFQQSAASLARLNEILELELPNETATVTRIDRPLGLLEIDRVSFLYEPGRIVLDNISARIAPGMKVAIVGPTGCGKTTLLQLLTRFYELTSGEIRLDGAPIRTWPLGELRRHIGVVSQEPTVFRRSVADNIRYGIPAADRLRVEAAAHAAHVHEFVSRLPQGYDTIIGQGGHKLSLGERQRIAIARALCKDPALVVLDEATSSLDADSETLIQDALANLLRGRTTLIIAHRLSTIVDADFILVMNAGRIVQVGTHAELAGQPNTLYGEMCRRQFGDLIAANA